MSPRLQKIIGIASVVIVGLLLWPVFSAGDPWMLVLLIVFLGATGVLTVLALRTRSKHVVRYALLGVLPGFIVVGTGVWAIARLTNAGPDGWEDLYALLLATVASFVGAVLGAIAGAWLGWRVDRKAKVG